MKASELRIGNIVSGVYCDWPDKKREQITVDAITSIGINLEYGDTMYYEDTLQGIPLNEEWLLKFGFENSKLSVAGILEFVYHNGSIYIRGISGAIHPRDCQYVHQLQNLYFALTGEELTIE